jgi:hypothetical protein
MINALFFFCYIHVLQLHFKGVPVMMLPTSKQLNLCIRCVSMVRHCLDFHVALSCYHVCPTVLISMLLSYCPHDFHVVPLLPCVSQSPDFHVVVPLSSRSPCCSKILMFFMKSGFFF